MKGLTGFGRLLTVLSLSFVVGAGCVSWKHGWETGPFSGAAGLDTGAVKEYAIKLEKSAVTREQIEDLIDSLEHILSVEPSNRDVMNRLAKAWVAMAVGHSRDMPEKGTFLRRAISIAEKSMMLNQGFASVIEGLDDKQRSVPAASFALDASSACAAGVWSLAVLMYYEECTSEALKRTDKDLLDGVARVAARHMELMPEGGKAFSLALRGMIQAVRPGAKMVMVAADFDAAAAENPESILIRWLQAKYLYSNFGDKTSRNAAFDVIKSIDLDSSKGFMPLNRVIRLCIERKK